MIEKEVNGTKYVLVKEPRFKKSGEESGFFLHFLKAEKLKDGIYHKKNKAGIELSLKPIDEMPIGKNGKPLAISVRVNKKTNKEIMPILIQQRTPEELIEYKKQKALLRKEKLERRKLRREKKHNKEKNSSLKVRNKKKRIEKIKKINDIKEKIKKEKSELKRLKVVYRETFRAMKKAKGSFDKQARKLKRLRKYKKAIKESIKKIKHNTKNRKQTADKKA